ncbi:MAG: C25 family cysteine peptidase [Bacteroidales bacterium]
MRKILIVCMLLPLFALGQRVSTGENSEPVREVTVQPGGEVRISWEFPGFVSQSITENGTTFEKINLEGFGFLHDIGKPDLPAYIDHIAAPEDAEVSVNVSEVEYYPTEQKVFLMPAQPPKQDNYLSDDPPFRMDTAFYEKDLTYPEKLVTVNDSQRLRDIKVAAVQISPFAYNPAKKELKAVKSITVEVTFGSGNSQITDPEIHSRRFAGVIGRYFLNGAIVQNDILDNIKKTPDKAKGISDDPNYLIVTTPDYLTAAEKLSDWKAQLGFRTEIISQSSWSAGQVKSAIHDRYANYSPKPDYFVIIGDHGDVPGEMHTNNNKTYGTDHYYAVMNASVDYTADMAKGRISATSSAQAEMIVDKVIGYEKTPVADTSFYNTGLACAYFQHAGGGYAERRFAQTSEELRDYAVSLGYNVNRVYYAHSYVNPTYWNNTYYSNGEPLPSSLTKPSFAWDGDRYDIINHVNNGAFFVFHRDHGYEHGWGDPAFNNNDVNSFSNGDKLPVFFSINCLTGKFIEAESFAEKLLRKSNGGAAGVFAHAEVSYSGYNDALSLGLFDGIWSNPGLVPNFTGSGGVSNPNLTPHGDIRTGGYLVNHGLARMEATWGSSKYSHELLHYHGDPAMEFYVDFPDPISADPIDSLMCNADTSLIINNLDTDSVTATLVVNGTLEGRSILNGPADTLSFNPVAGNFALLTLSKAGHAPHVDTIDIAGGCPKAVIEVAQSKLCVGDSITFSENSFGNIASYKWMFDTTASMDSASSAGPHKLIYNSGGTKTVYLTVATPSGISHTDSVILDISALCDYSIPSSGHLLIDNCSGKLYDDGGPYSDYSHNSDGSVTIAPPGASYVTLTFSSFDFEPGYDYLYIYDGSSTNDPLIGSYDGTSLPGGGVINSSSNAITLQQITDAAISESGFELEWQCVYPNTAPTGDFTTDDTVSCTGIVDFRDQSMFGPNSWEWDFGDGNTSVMQNPTHQYAANGDYTVKLKVSNAFGQDSLVKHNYISVDMPGTPSAQSGIRCHAGSVDLNASPPPGGGGYIRWFNSLNSSNVLDTGNTFTTPILGNSRSYFIDYAREEPSVFGAKQNNAGGGGYFGQSYKHHLVFDVHEPAKLVSVKVYANSSGNRQIELRDQSENVIQTKTVYIPSGESRINLNMDLQPGYDYQLAGPESPDLYRNSSGLNYPYAVDNIATIKRSSASSDPTGYYYYFYDWEVRGSACRSQRVEVEAVISDTLSPLPDFDFDKTNDPEVQFNENSEYAKSYLWEFGDGTTSTKQNPTHTYTANGTYDVKLKVFNDCGEDSVIKQVQIETVSIDQYTEKPLSVYPNPTTDFITIELPGEIKGDVLLQIVDQTGKHVDAETLNVQNDKVIRKSLENMAAGTYYIMIHKEGETYMSKIVLQ